MLSFAISIILVVSSPAEVEVTVSPGTRSDFPSIFHAIDSLDLSNPNQPYWARVDIKSPPDSKYILQGGNWYMQNIQFFNAEKELIGTGNHISISPPMEISTFYLFYSFRDTKDTNNFSLHVFEVEEFLIKKSTKDIFQTGFHAVLIFVLLVTVFFVVRSKNKVYLHYAYYIGSILIFFSYQYGLLGQVPLIKSISPSWPWIFSASLSYAYALFARSFLNMKETDPFNYKWLGYAMKYIILVVSIESISLLFNYDILHVVWYKSLVIIFQIGLMIVFLYRIIKMNTLIGNIFVIGSFVLLLATLTGQIASTFKIAYATNTFVQIGVLLDVFILSIGIAVRMSLVQQARREAQAKLIDQLQLNEKFQQEYLEKLEIDVVKRTSDLAHRNLENETLLKEVHHRVKNNLQMITSLLNMQQRRLNSEEAKDALGLAKNRVKSIGLIHEHLYKHQDFSKIDLADYISELVNILIKSLHKGAEIKTHLTIENVKAPIETALPVGLILNELITNSIKYAFSDQDEPLLEVRLGRDEDQITLEVIDNGPGIIAEESKSGFGHSIINTLLESMSGSIGFENKSDGLHATVRFTTISYSLKSPAN